MFTEDDVGLLGDYIVEMLACLDKLMAGEKNDFDAGQVEAYLHLLRLVQGSMFEDDLKKTYGLDIDLDRKYTRAKWDSDK